MVRIWGLIILVIYVFAILDVLKREPSNEKRLLWIVIILLLPVAGALAWYAISRKIIKI
ncbi:MAG: PLDc N-terminal domain-containing protein [Cyclobacteriaceae bacterium]